MNTARSIRIGCLFALTYFCTVVTGAQNSPANGLQFAAGPSNGQHLANVQWSSDYDLHAYFVDRFLESPGNGISRIYQDPMALHEFMRLRITSRDTYKLESLDLIGVGKHPEPVAFLGRRHQTVSRNRQTRPLSSFEQRAIAELRAGEDVAVQANDTSRVVVGALRAEQDCLKCHGGKTGDVLGALSYRLTLAERMNSVVGLNLKSRYTTE